MCLKIKIQYVINSETNTKPKLIVSLGLRNLGNRTATTIFKNEEHKVINQNHYLFKSLKPKKNHKLKNLKT